MRKLILAMTAGLLLLAIPARADDWSFIGSAHWLERSGEDRLQDVPAGASVDFNFDAGAGFGVGFLYEFADSWGIELKGSFARIDGTVRAQLPDAVFILDLEGVDVVPLTAVLQWRPLHDGKWEPYLGAGGGYIFLDDTNSSEFDRVEFDGDIGLVLNAGIDFQFGDRWSLNADAKYVPFESGIETRLFVGEGTLEFKPILGSLGLRYRF